MTAAESAERAQHYDPRDIQEKWQDRWAGLDMFLASDDPADDRPRTYLLDMFPYPSGDLHMGHAEAYAIADAVARYYFQRGHNVLHPIGWDAFGLPAENAAIRNNSHPADWTYANIETQAASFRRYAVSFDWSRRLQTCDPAYYRWNQWLFLRFYERGLAYRKDGYVNWCPHDQTVLANEQVIAGKCERCGTEVIRRVLTQWYFKITEYADRLLEDMAGLEGKWPDRVLLMQRNWIGRSEGAEIRFTIEGRDEPVTVFTTRPDTLFGATFFVVAADSPLAEAICSPEHREALTAYVAQVRKLTDIERQSTDREKTGVFLGCHAVNPVNGERIPVWAADYVLPDYGTGAIMGVPAHDQRDLDFARAHGLDVRVVVDTGAPDPAVTGVATHGDGVLINSGPLNGLGKSDAIARITQILESGSQGRAAVNFRLHDMGMVDFTEPFTRLMNQGQVINQGRAMSKSLGNGVDLGQQLAAHGVDAIRLTMIFASPPEDDIDWADMNPEASVKFLGRVSRLAAEAGAAPAQRPAGTGDIELRKVTHRTIDEVTRLVEATRLNVAVARLMELSSAARRTIDSGPGAADPAVREAAETLTVLLSLFAPYTAEECWELLVHEPSVAMAGWPAADPALLVQDLVTCVVQVSGKVRDRLEVPPGISEDELRELALAAPGVGRSLAGREIRKVIVRPPGLVNVVPA